MRSLIIDTIYGPREQVTSRKKYKVTYSSKYIHKKLLIDEKKKRL